MRAFFKLLQIILMLAGVILLSVLAASPFNESLADGVSRSAEAVKNELSAFRAASFEGIDEK